MVKTEYKTEYKNIKIPFELKEYNQEQGIFKGYASIIGNIDDNNDKILPGAFAKTLKEDFKRIKILIQHNQELLPIGKPLTIREDTKGDIKGLYVEGQISNTSTGKDVKILLKDEVLTELSMGYLPIDYFYDTKGIRNIRELKLFEISPVIWGMNDQTFISEYKQLKGVGDLDTNENKEIYYIDKKAFNFNDVLDREMLNEMLYLARYALRTTLYSIEDDSDIDTTTKLNKIQETLNQFTTVTMNTYKKLFNIQMNQKSIEENTIELKSLLDKLNIKDIPDIYKKEIKSNCECLLSSLETKDTNEHIETIETKDNNEPIETKDNGDTNDSEELKKFLSSIKAMQQSINN